MAGAKGAKLAARGQTDGPLRHHCPTCPEKDGRLMAMKAVMVMPGRRIEFVCDTGHRVLKGQTILY